ncbi:WecB/TagA/CpsF family glycosyltransferase [Arthrobacter sp. NPDC056691]|uniref:WecB/TagA/CpsF family glycosyltransferase n=1 Tax=Arthrobacter sp. NPDC056691 TaxID=3345913 RepID=UPI00366F4B62
MNQRPIRTSTADVRVHPVSESLATDMIVGTLDGPKTKPGLIVTPNMHHLAILESTDLLAGAYGRASLVLADGWPVVLLARMLGSSVRRRATGSGLVERLSQARVSGLRVCVIGGSSSASNQMAVQKFAISGWAAFGQQAPRHVVEDKLGRLQLIRDVISSEPSLIIVGIGSPKQEVLGLELLENGFTGWILCAGAGVDFLSGQVRRSPGVLRVLGLEWLHRIASEPRRLLVRYGSDILPFICVAFRSLSGKPPA